MLQHTYLVELECDARRADYLRESRADYLAKHIRRADTLSGLSRLAALFHARPAAPGWKPTPAHGRDRRRLRAA